MLAFTPDPDGPLPKWPPFAEKPYVLWPKPFPGPLLKLFKECTPRILVVTDGLGFSPANGFGLSQFVDTIRAAPVHGMLPSVVTAHRGADASADISSFTFDATVTKHKYDVIFLFGISSATPGAPGASNNLPQGELDVLTQFMQDGGGLFATGDHESLGAALSGNLPRVRAMRHWYTPAAPSASSPTRITTNSPGANGAFEFDDQSDAIPQRIYPRYFAAASSVFVSAPHALLQAPPIPASGAAYQPIEFAPDHPHEGECIEPANLSAHFAHKGAKLDEWPALPGTKLRKAPQVIAYGMTYGGAFSGKQAVSQPRSFGLVGAYDGHAVDVGRVAVDSTWHHFVNINIDGTSTARSGLREPDPAAPGQLRDTAELSLIRRYWANLANWLMPEHVRHCLVWGKYLAVLDKPILIEELAGWPKDGPRRKDPAALRELAGLASSLLAFASTPAEVAEAQDDLTGLTLGKEGQRAWVASHAANEAGRLEALGAAELQQAALGATVLALNDLTEPGRSLAESVEAKGGFHALGELVAGPARKETTRALGELRKRAKAFDKSLDNLEQVLG